MFCFLSKHVMLGGLSIYLLLQILKGVEASSQKYSFIGVLKNSCSPKNSQEIFRNTV